MCRRLALILLASGLVALGADAPRTKLRVEVTNHKGKPISRASVLVKFSDGRSIKKFGRKHMRQWELRTNQEGIASFPTMPQGKVLVLVNAERYQTFWETYEIAEEEKTLQIKLNPPQQQYSAHQ